MSDHNQPDIPPVEQPQTTADVTLEERTLEKAAKSAPFRDLVERKQHLENLNRRIDVLQNKLDRRETDVMRLLPRFAELEHSRQLSQILVRDGTIISVVGGGLISAGGLFFDNVLRFFLAGSGGAFLICGLWIAKVLNRNAFPAKPNGWDITDIQEPHVQQPAIKK